MTRKILCSAFILGLFFMAFQNFAAEETQEITKECCLVREGYQGTCRVTPGKEETCGSILKYLNTPGTVGKSYCGGSKLRGGWESVDCEKNNQEEVK
jgi:hypothetical protein